MPRPIQALIHLDGLRHNLAQVRQHAAARRVWAVIKANAYGHGIERVLPAFAQADGLALLDLAEAERARAAGWRKPILLLEGVFEARDLDVVSRLDLAAVVHEERQVQWLQAARPARAIDVHLKLNTGMNRLGFRPADCAALLARLGAGPAVRVTTVMMHFANSDVPEIDGPAGIAAQLTAFEQALPGWQGQRSLANSAALFLQPQVGGDWVRPGIALYGGTPRSGLPATALNLQAGMTLRSRLIAIQQLQAGECVGYGARWRATRACRIGVVACGYADGYPRVAPDGTPVAVDGQRVPLVGRVSMDMITVDLTDAPQAQVGSSVELWGRQVPIDTVAARCGAVGYELMCALAPRVPVEVID
ncbi:MAG: alanine racemase [Burkholderiaceae bacterium]|nr:alanine racemase [Burkholderiaceae bacterium]